MVVHYEQLVQEPQYQVQRLCDRLGIAFAPEMITYGSRKVARWRMGDQGTTYQHQRPVSQYAKKWQEALDNPQTWRFASDYLRLLGPVVMESMGYSYEEASRILAAHRHHRIREWFTLPLNWFVNKRVEDRAWWLREARPLARSLASRGVWGTARAIARRTAHALSKSE